MLEVHEAADANPNLDPLAVDSLETAKSNAALAEEATPSSTGLHRVTPLLFSEILSRRTGHNVFLKLDALQPSGSFKIRGVGRITQLALQKYGQATHIVTSSGGNAGLAAATACKMLSLKCSIYVPHTTEEAVIAMLVRLGAKVHVVHGAWDEADAEARKFVDSEAGAVYLHPFIGEDLVDGHASLAHEIYEQMQIQGRGRPDVIICTVGGGGLIGGVLRGLGELKSKLQNFVPPRVVATQDFGADSFSQSMNLFFQDPQSHADTLVTLPAITSKATSMGTKRCSPDALEAARAYAMQDPESSADPKKRYLATVVQSDSIAASSAWQFKRDHDIMVELSCGAALSPVYHSERILPSLLEGLSPGKKNIVVEVCGGSKIDLEMLESYEQEVGDMAGKGLVSVNGHPV